MFVEGTQQGSYILGHPSAVNYYRRWCVLWQKVLGTRKIVSWLQENIHREKSEKLKTIARFLAQLYA